MLTCPCKKDPLTPHFYIGNGGLQGYTLFSFFPLKHRLWERVLTIYVLNKNNQNVTNFHLKIIVFTADAVKNCSI